MGSYLRDGADLHNCDECGRQYDINDPERLELREGARFQPLCLRCLRVRMQDGEVCCSWCCEYTDITDANTVPHLHTTNEIGAVFICSQSCLVKYINKGPYADQVTHTSPKNHSESHFARTIANSTTQDLNMSFDAEFTLYPQLVYEDSFDFVVGCQPYSEEQSKRIADFFPKETTHNGQTVEVRCLGTLPFGLFVLGYEKDSA